MFWGFCSSVCPGQTWTLHRAQTFSSYTGYHPGDHDSSAPLCVPANLTPRQIKTSSFPIMPFDSPLPPKRIQSALYSPICPLSNPFTKEPHTIFPFFLDLTEKLTLLETHILLLPLCAVHTHTHTRILHLCSHSTRCSIPSIKPGDRCWISFLEEKSSAPLIGAELAWRAGRQVHHETRGQGDVCVCVCLCARTRGGREREDIAQSSHLGRGKVGASGQACFSNWRG